jgi:hypothetical protein
MTHNKKWRIVGNLKVKLKDSAYSEYSSGINRFNLKTAFHILIVPADGTTHIDEDWMHDKTY